MNKLRIVSTFAVALLFVFLTFSVVSAYHHTTFELSDKITFKEDIRGENRGFTLKRTADVSRLNSNGAYDWSYRPRVNYPDQSAYRISDRLALEAFKTFQADSKYQNKIQLKREDRNRRYGSYSRGYGYSWGYSSRPYGYYSSWRF